VGYLLLGQLPDLLNKVLSIANRPGLLIHINSKFLLASSIYIDIQVNIYRFVLAIVLLNVPMCYLWLWARGQLADVFGGGWFQ
jgi:hypothetical protein